MSYKSTKEVEIGTQRIAEELRRIQAVLEDPIYPDRTHEAVRQCALLAEAVAVLAKEINDLREAADIRTDPW